HAVIASHKSNWRVGRARDAVAEEAGVRAILDRHRVARADLGAAAKRALDGGPGMTSQAGVVVVTAHGNDVVGGVYARRDEQEQDRQVAHDSLTVAQSSVPGRYEACVRSPRVSLIPVSREVAA